MAQSDNLAEQLFGNQQQPMGVIEAMAAGLTQGVKALADGVGKAYDLAQSSPAFNHAGAHGTHELAAALFNGSAFVLYPRGTHEDHGVHGPQQSQEQDHQHEQQHERGRSM